MRHRIEPVAPEGMAARQPPDAEPHPACGAVAAHRFGHVVRARRLKPAAAGEQRRQQDFIRAQESEHCGGHGSDSLMRAAGRGRGGRGWQGSRLQGWRTKHRAFPGAARSRCRARQPTCGGGRFRGQVVWHGYGGRHFPFCATRRRPAVPGTRRLVRRTPS